MLLLEIIKTITKKCIIKKPPDPQRGNLGKDKNLILRLEDKLNKNFKTIFTNKTSPLGAWGL